MLLRKAILLTVALLIGASASFAGNANGIGYFALEIPSGVTMNIDGNGDDWGWFDQTFAYGPDDMIEIITGNIGNYILDWTQGLLYLYSAGREGQWPIGKTRRYL